MYGLSDSSRVWYLRVAEELNKLNVHVSNNDKALFIWKKDGHVEKIIVVHVNDFLWCGSEEFSVILIEKIKTIFKVSKESNGVFKYICIDLKQEEHSLKHSQKSYVDSI